PPPSRFLRRGHCRPSESAYREGGGQTMANLPAWSAVTCWEDRCLTSRRERLEALQRWGWNETWHGRFAPFAEAGYVPGRVSVEHRELYHFHGPHGEGVAQVSGRLRHRAGGRADFPAVGDWVALRPAPHPGPAPVAA